MGIRARDTEYEFTAQVRLPGLAATGTNHGLFRAPFPCQITAVEWIPDAQYIAAAPTNDTIITLRKNNVAGAAGIIAGGTSIAAATLAKGSFNAIPLSTTLAQTQLDSPDSATSGSTKDTVTADVTINGTGAATPMGTLLIRYKALKRASNVK